MKKKVTLALLLATSMLFVGCDKLKGVDKTPPAPQPQTTQGQVLPPVQQPSASAATPAQQDPMLQIFNQSVKITAISRSIAHDNKKNEGSLITYRLENIGKKAITSVAWRSVFTTNNQAFHATSVALNLAQQPLQPNSKIEISALDLFKAMPKQAPEFFKTTNQPINVLFVAREISFADGTKIIIAE